MKKKTIISNNSKKHYIGSCVNSFDEDGLCTINLPYYDVTDFAQSEEEYIDVSDEEFFKNTNAELFLPEISKNLLFLKDEDNDLYVLYDVDSDIHYFFA